MSYSMPKQPAGHQQAWNPTYSGTVVTLQIIGHSTKWLPSCFCLCLHQTLFVLYKAATQRIHQQAGFLWVLWSAVI